MFSCFTEPFWKWNYIFMTCFYSFSLLLWLNTWMKRLTICEQIVSCSQQIWIYSIPSSKLYVTWHVCKRLSALTYNLHNYHLHMACWSKLINWYSGNSHYSKHSFIFDHMQNDPFSYLKKFVSLTRKLLEIMLPVLKCICKNRMMKKAINIGRDQKQYILVCQTYKNIP